MKPSSRTADERAPETLEEALRLERRLRQAAQLTDRELGYRLLSGRWTTADVFEAARRLGAA